MNTGGVVHSDEEIARVQKLLDEELAKKVSREVRKEALSHKSFVNI